MNLQVITSTDYLIHCLIVNVPAKTSPPLQSTFVYDPPVLSLKGMFWDDLNKIGEAADQCDKIGGKSVASTSRDTFRTMVDTNGLIDLGYIGYPYTWNNRRAGKANIQERLDRGFANGAWRLLFPTATITHFTALRSDHRPILLATSLPTSSRPKPFRFEAMWTRDLSAGIIIDQAWNKHPSYPSLSNLTIKLRTTKLALKHWNHAHFGHLQTNIQAIKRHLDHLQSLTPSPTTLQLEKSGLEDLDELLVRERILWMQKAKSKWLEEGDTNTHFFHLSTIIHRKSNHIHHILDHHNVLVSDYDTIGVVFVKFFTNLYTSSLPSFPFDLQGLISPSVFGAANTNLTTIPSDVEIHRSLISMANNKSLGLHGMSPVFFKTYWSIIVVDVINAVQNFFSTGKLNKAVNHTFITLVPKRLAANKVELFRPIALCNVIYKLITKILSSGLKGLLVDIIHLNQATFIPNQSISDNCIINHEVMFYLNSKQGKTIFMAIKVDMAKAYDMVEWATLITILHNHGFCTRFCDLLIECLSTAQYFIIVNGSLCGFFSASRGIRQGDPISPALFTLLSDFLSRILARAENSRCLSGVKISRGSPCVTHLMYANDLFIYCKANEAEAQEGVKCLQLYCDWTGQQIIGENQQYISAKTLCDTPGIVCVPS